MIPRIQHSIIGRMFALAALLLACAWVPLSSHEWLESAGWIHQEGASDNHDHGAAHDAADGHCRVQETGIFVKIPVLSMIGCIAALFVLDFVRLLFTPPAVSPLRQATASPPGIVESWQFALRLALPSRAPALVN